MAWSDVHFFKSFLEFSFDDDLFIRVSLNMKNFFKKFSQISFWQKIWQDNKMWFKVSAGLLLSGFILGFVLGVLQLPAMMEVVEEGLENSAETIDKISQGSFAERVGELWLQNVFLAGIMIFLGFVLGFVSSLSIFNYGLSLGLLLGVVVMNPEDLKLVEFLSSLALVVFFYLPSYIAAAAWGCKIGLDLWRPVWKSKRLERLNHCALEGTVLFIFISFWMLVPVLIEAWQM